jgi:hypothetical protein
MEENKKKILKAFHIYPEMPEEYAENSAFIPVPGQPKRDWMDESPNKFAYKCLPLTIANMHGWDFLAPCDIEMFWNGDNRVEGVFIRHMIPEKAPKFANSHFGSGTVTFNFPYIFRTPPGWGLMVQGPPNNPKRGISPLQGIVETDWLPATFTMNWKITEPWYTVKFEKGEPICRLMPIRFPDIEDWEWENPSLASNPELHKGYEAWKKKRGDLLDHLRTVTRKTGELPPTWKDHDYIKGAVGEAVAEHHRSTLKLKEFKYGKDGK